MLRESRLTAICKQTNSKSPETAVRKLVRKLLCKYGNSHPPFTPERFCEMSNVKIERTYLTDCDARLLPVLGGYVAEVCADHPKTRQNFSLCHEVAHTFFESNPSTNLKAFSCSISPINESRIEERLCNYAAAEMLMPAKIFRRIVLDFQPSLTSIRTIAKIFETSTQAVITRIIDLDLWQIAAVCFYPLVTQYSGLGFNILWWRSSASAFNNYLKSEELIYCLRNMAYSPTLLSVTGISESFTTGRQIQGELAIQPLQKSFSIQSFKVYQIDIPTVFSLILRASPN